MSAVTSVAPAELIAAASTVELPGRVGSANKSPAAVRSVGARKYVCDGFAAAGLKPYSERCQCGHNPDDKYRNARLNLPVVNAGHCTMVTNINMKL